MSKKDSIVFKLEMRHSIINWGCQNSSEGEDYYRDIILPFNIGDTITRNDKQYKVTTKDWDYDNNTVYFTFSKDY